MIGPAPRRVEIVRVGPLDGEEELLDWLAGALEARLGAPVSAGEPLELREEWRDAGRGQVNSNRIVDALVARDDPRSGEPPDRWLLAVTEADLFAPGRDFVFGEAAQGGAWALIGLARLRARLNSPDPGALLRRRILKEAAHELGHLAGLEHCDRPECVMFPSETLEDTDRKSASLCPACEAALRDLSGLDRPADPR